MNRIIEPVALGAVGALLLVGSLAHHWSVVHIAAGVLLGIIGTARYMQRTLREVFAMGYRSGLHDGARHQREADDMWSQIDEPNGGRE